MNLSKRRASRKDNASINLLCPQGDSAKEVWLQSCSKLPEKINPGWSHKGEMETKFTAMVRPLSERPSVVNWYATPETTGNHLKFGGSY